LNRKNSLFYKTLNAEVGDMYLSLIQGVASDGRRVAGWGEAQIRFNPINISGINI